MLSCTDVGRSSGSGACWWVAEVRCRAVLGCFHAHREIAAWHPHLQKHRGSVQFSVVAQLTGDGHPGRREGDRDEEKAEDSPAASLDLVRAGSAGRKAAGHGGERQLRLCLEGAGGGRGRLVCRRRALAGGRAAVAPLLLLPSGRYWVLVQQCTHDAHLSQELTKPAGKGRRVSRRQAQQTQHFASVQLSTP